MTPEQYAELREPFPAALIGTRDGFDYVGHAAVTDRLNKVDPAWTWTPLSVSGVPEVKLRKVRDGTDKNGNPFEVFLAGMWISLTVCGVTRPAYGEVEQYPWSDNIEKRLISDAVKNGAMRFGVAVDLWAKEDLHAEPPVSKEQVTQIADVLAAIVDEDARKAAQAAWKARWGSPLALPASAFDEAHGHAKDLAAESEEASAFDDGP